MTNLVKPSVKIAKGDFELKTIYSSGLMVAYLRPLLLQATAQLSTCAE